MDASRKPFVLPVSLAKWIAGSRIIVTKEIYHGDLVAAGCGNVVKPLDWAMRPDASHSEQIKIITEYCPHGNLRDLIRWYRREKYGIPILTVH